MMGTDWVKTAATMMVAQWEHGDEAHRKWLRDIATPTIENELRLAYARGVEDASKTPSQPMGYWTNGKYVTQEFLPNCTYPYTVHPPIPDGTYKVRADGTWEYIGNPYDHHAPVNIPSVWIAPDHAVNVDMYGKTLEDCKQKFYNPDGSPFMGYDAHATGDRENEL